MSGRPNSFMKMYWSDYFMDTRHLNTLQHGAYLLLIAYYWNSGKPLPDDDKILQRITGLHGNSWKSVRKILDKFFTINNGVWSHKRIDAELKKSTEIYDKKVAAGNTLKDVKSIEINRKSIENQSKIDKKLESDFENKSLKIKETHQAYAIADASQPEPEPDTYVNISREKEEKNIKRRNSESELIERGLKIYNAVVEKYGGQVCKILNPAKKSRLLRRISDAGGIETFETILTEAVEKSQFLQGKIPPREGYNQFKLSMKFICQEDSFNNILNGVYNDTRAVDGVFNQGFSGQSKQRNSYLEAMARANF